MQVAFYLAGEITQVTESIPWVRCASGNVYLLSMLVCFGLRHGRLCNIAKVWTLSTLLGDCPTLMDSHLHNLKGGTYVSKKLVGRSIPRLAKKAFHSNGVTLASPPLQQILETTMHSRGQRIDPQKVKNAPHIFRHT